MYVVSRAMKEEIYEYPVDWEVRFEEKDERNEVSVLVGNMEDMGLNLSPLDFPMVDYKQSIE